MILLVMAKPPVALAERPDLWALQLLRIFGRPAHDARPATHVDCLADRRLRDRRIDRARCSRRVRQGALRMRHAS
jgi:hypothetical protein